MNDLLLKNRKVRIDLATHAGRGDQHGGGGRDGGRHREEADDRTAGDWRSGPAPSRDDDRKDRYEPPRDRGELNELSARDKYKKIGLDSFCGVKPYNFINEKFVTSLLLITH